MLSYQQALAQSERARHLLAVAYQQQQNQQNNQALLELACAFFQEVLDSEHEIANAYLGLATLIYANGDPHYALRLLQNAEQLEPFNLEIATLRKQFQSPSAEIPSSTPGLEVLTSWSKTSEAKTMSPAERLLGDLHGIFPSQTNLSDLMQIGLGYTLNQSDLLFLYRLLTQPFEETQATDLKKLSQLLAALDPKYRRSIKLFVNDLLSASASQQISTP